MAHSQRLGALGIGVEAIAGTYTAPTHWLQLAAAPTIKDLNEYENIETARGRIEKTQGQKLMREGSEGSLELHLDETVAPIPFGLVLGSLSSASAGGSLYDHTITINNTNTAKTASLTIDRVADVRQYPNSVLSQLNVSLSDGFVSLKLDFKGGKGATGTASDSYVEETNFAFHEMTAQFGATVSAAAAAAATPLSGFEMTVAREASPVYQSGSTEPVKIPQGPMEFSGNYSLLFEDTTEHEKYLNNTANAGVFTFTNGDNYIKITLPKINISNWEADNELDDIVTQTAEYGAHYDSIEGEGMRVVVRNATESYANF